MTEPSALSGRLALVLGAGTPAGRAIALALAEAGADVAVASSSLDGEEVMACRRTRRAIEKLGRRSAEYAFDVTLGQNVQVSTRQVAKEMGGLNILVWAVSSLPERPADKVTDAEWSRAIAANVSGAFFACRAALREMLAADGGRLILVVPSPGGGPGEPQTVSHVAAGAAVGLIQGLAVEFGGRGIAAYGITPWAPDSQVSGEHPDLPDALPAGIGALAVLLASSPRSDYSGGVYPGALPV